MAFMALPFIFVPALATAALDVAFLATGAGLLAAHSIKLSTAMKGVSLAKASAEAATTAKTAYTAYTAATASTTAAATAATTAATTATATAATATTTTATAAASASASTTSTAAWLASMAMTPAGIVVIGGVAGCAAYYAYRVYRSWKANPNKPPKPVPEPKEPHDPGPPNENNNPGGPPPGFGKPVLIPKKELKRLLHSEGRRMYDKLRSVLTGNKDRKIWSNNDYRIDPGHTMHGNPNLKTWNLQPQGQAESATARKLMQKFGTHVQLLWDVFDMTNPPSYAAWVRRLLSLFD